jgi:Cu2+-exporting ATPase
VALPLADDLAASFVRRLGVFLREGSLWSRLRSVRKIIFDKTGTLTLETMALRNPESLAALPADEKAVLIAMVSDSLHPVSCCLRELSLAEGVEATASLNVKEFVGLGLEQIAGRDVWRLGRSGWAGNAEGDCVFSRNEEVLAAFSFEESVRTDAVEEIAALQKQGREVFILSGDRPQKVAAMAVRLGLPSANCHAAMSPQQKADWVHNIDQHDTLLIGDGANDSLAFNAAHCTGTPAIDRGLLEQKADFYFLGRGLSGIRQLFATADRRRRTVRRVIGFALLYNFVAITISLVGAMSPVVAAVLMPLSSLVSLAIVFLGRPR